MYVKLSVLIMTSAICTGKRRSREKFIERDVPLEALNGIVFVARVPFTALHMHVCVKTNTNKI
jgi:hypothetical protein